jgi:hypothetical protein
MFWTESLARIVFPKLASELFQAFKTYQSDEGIIKVSLMAFGNLCVHDPIAVSQGMKQSGISVVLPCNLGRSVEVNCGVDGI